jgi:predicted ATPase
MKIVGVEVEGVGGLADGAYSFAASDGAPAPVILVAGDAGSGKTRLLEAVIAAKEGVGSWGSGSRFAALRREGVERASIVARWNLSVAECDEGRLSASEFTTRSLIDEKGVAPADCPIGLKRLFQTHDEGGLTRFGYLHAGRAWPSYGVPEAQVFTMLSADNRKFGHLMPRAIELLAEDQARAARAVAEGGLALPGERSHMTDLREALRPFLPRHALASFVRDKHEGNLIFQTKRAAQVTSSAMSASERDALLVALDAMMNHRAGGIVLLDEPELHRHPDEQLAFVNAYRGALRETQIIMATSSPHLLGMGAEAAHVVRLRRSAS